MATTLVACSFRYDRAVVAHVGDSRCYLVRRGEAMVLTRDHTVVSDQMRLGLLSAREGAEASTRHVLSRSLGSDLFVNVDTSEHQVFTGDVLVLCSDGLHGSVEKSEIAALTGNGGDLTKAAQKLVALANERDGSDNISVQLIRVRGVERVGNVPRAALQAPLIAPSQTAYADNMTPVHPGDQLDHYRIESLVARSGMASIFRGTDLRTGRPGRHQGSPSRDGERPGLVRPLSARGGNRPEAGSPRRDEGVRRRGPQPALHGDGVGGRAAAAPNPQRAGEASRRARGEDRARHLRRPGLHSQPRRGAPRSEAGKHHGGRGRPHQADRLRHRGPGRSAAADLRQAFADHGERPITSRPNRSKGNAAMAAATSTRWASCYTKC